LTPLEDLLQQCTVKITIPSGWGTGFFVAPGLILTCAHVVRKAADLQVTVSSPVWQQPLSAIVKAKADDGKTLDLALVELSEPLPDHPCVLLDEEPVAVGQALYSYGYLESYTNAAPVRPINEGLTGDTPPLLKLQGAQIEKGISGAALLNLKTGKVCGMVKETRAAGFDLGGGAIPTRVILEQFPELRSLQQSFHGGVGAACPSDNRRWINLITPPGIYFQPYRKAVIDHYSQQCHLYTPTDALLPLEARSVERQAQDEGQKQQPEKMGEPFPVLDGLRKYALGTKREHVLLAGRPGSGKSTTLRQLAMSLAQEGQVPVLVQLKGDLSVPDLIQAEFRRMRRRVTSEQVDEWLFDDRLVLLLDGVNEIPNDDLRRKLAQFRDDNLTVPMIFTTRALLGDDLGINKRLEMKPLSPTQMREFVGKYLQEQGDRLLEQLRDRLRELAETPLLLKLLCDVFDPETNQIPQNRGELFQWFDRDYRRIKKEIEYVPVSENFWEFKSEILQYLAFSMIQGEMQTADLQKPSEPWLTISKSRAEGILETWLRKREILDAPTKAKLWLKDLCNHDLLQDAAKPEEIEFHHQLFQEYYAAEYLLKLLPNLTDDQLKQDYLNNVKWTEPLAISMSFVESNTAEKIVRLALKIDLCLGTRLVGSIKSTSISQKIVVELANKPDIEIKYWFKAELLGITRLDNAVPYLEKMLQQYQDYILRWHVINALELINSKAIIDYLIQGLNDADPSICFRAKDALKNISDSPSINLLIQILEDQEQPVDIREKASDLLFDTSLEKLLKFQRIVAENSEQKLQLRRIAAHGISKVNKQLALKLFHQMLHDDCETSKDSCEIIAIDLREIRSEDSIQPLLEILENEENFIVRGSAAITLGSIGSQKAISPLLEILKIRSEKLELHNESSALCSKVAYALRGYALQELFEISLKILKKPWEDVDLRSQTLNILCNQGDQEIIEEFKNIIFDGSEDQKLRIDAIRALKFLHDWIPSIAKKILDSQLSEDVILKHEIINILQELDRDESIKLLTDVLRFSENSGLKSHAISALHRYGDREDILSLLKKALKNSHQDVRQRAAKSLARPGNEGAVGQLLELLERGDSSDHQSAIFALGSIGSEKAYDALLRVFQDNVEDLSIRNLAIWALTQIDVRRTLELLTEHLKHIKDRDLLKEIIIALGKSSEPKAVELLLEVLIQNDEDSMIQNHTLYALGQVATPEHISTLINLPPIMSDGVITAIKSIQSRYGFYNHEVYQKHLLSMNLKPENIMNHSLPTYVNQYFLGSVNGVAGNVEGDQNILLKKSCSKKDEYERILFSLQSMALVMERNPKTFCLIEEEDLRNHFLVQLNGYYKGQATGETVNGLGKTDIIIRLEDENIFIGECKFWKGKEELLRTLDQLLGYTTWRDNQLGILVFSRNKNFSAVLEKIPAIIREHSSFSQEGDHSETIFRFVLKKINDPDYKMDLEILVFNIPSDSEEISKN
jgi:HEAT repeat protein/energy-coupling factor transporter ATP-binding protein EcfA2